MKRHCLLATTLLIGFLTQALAEKNWYQFRGPTGRGHSADKNVPVEWNKDSIKWSTPLDGTGQSSPVNWGNNIFLTSAENDGKTRNLYCIDLETGKVKWKRSVPCKNPETAHKMNTQATPSCATDGKRVYVFFGPAGFYCYDMEGTEQWKHELGDFPGSWGIAASPIIVGDHVIQNCDCSGPSRLVAFDRKTGDIAWDTKRVTKPRGGWSSPILIKTNDGKEEIVLNGEFGVRGYDPTSGEELWFCEGFNGRGAPVPDYADGSLFVVNGKPGDLYSVTPGGKGNVTKTHRRWNQGRKAGRDLPSPAVVGNYMLTVSMSGIGCCIHTETGELLWHERLPVKGEFAASPMVANGLVYFTNVFGGETIVIRPGKKLEIVAKNSLGTSAETFRSTLAPIDGKLLIRSQTALHCVESK